MYSASLDNNGMKYVVRIQAETKGGTLSNADGKLTVKGADEVVFYITADTDYKPTLIRILKIRRRMWVSSRKKQPRNG